MGKQIKEKKDDKVFIGGGAMGHVGHSLHLVTLRRVVASVWGIGAVAGSC